jgi:hypothetical protein
MASRVRQFVGPYPIRAYAGAFSAARQAVAATTSSYDEGTSAVAPYFCIQVCRGGLPW